MSFLRLWFLKHFMYFPRLFPFFNSDFKNTLYFPGLSLFATFYTFSFFLFILSFFTFSILWLCPSPSTLPTKTIYIYVYGNLGYRRNPTWILDRLLKQEHNNPSSTLLVEIVFTSKDCTSYSLHTTKVDTMESGKTFTGRGHHNGESSITCKNVVCPIVLGDLQRNLVM